MDDRYSDVDSSTSDGESVAAAVDLASNRTSPSSARGGQSEVYDLIVTAEMCKMLNKTKPELAEIAARIESEMGVTRKSVLLAIPETIRIRYGIPARLNLWLSTLPQAAGLSAGSTSTAQSFASLLYVDGLNHGLRNDEITALIRTIVHERRITSLYALLQLEENDLDQLIEPTAGEERVATRAEGEADDKQQLSPGVLYYIRRHLLKLKEDAHTSLSVRQVLTLLAGGLGPQEDISGLGTAGRAAGGLVRAASSRLKTPRPSHLSQADTATPEWISETCVKLAERYNLHHIEQITRTLSAEDLKQIVCSEKLPFAAYLLLKRFCRNPPPQHYLHQKPITTTPIRYVEPTVEELIMRVGSHYGHPANETAAAKKILVDENWLTELEHLRVVDKNYLTQLNLSPILVDNLVAALKNPEILNMHQYDLMEATQDDRIAVREAVDDLATEVPSEHRKLEVFQSFVRLFQHLILTPSDASKRLVRKDNPIFRKTEPYRASHALLGSIGYVEYDDCFLLPVLHMEKTRYAHELLAGRCNEICKASHAGADTLPELQRYMSSAWEAMRDQLSAAVGKG